MQAEHDLGGGGSFDAQALRADGHAAIGADLQDRAHAPHVVPPSTAWGPTDHGASFLEGLIPGPLRSLAQFAMDFAGVAMRPQIVDVRVGFLDLVNLLAGEVGE